MNIIYWFLGILVICGVSLILYYLLLLFFMENKRKKLICGILTAIIVLTSVFFFIRRETRDVIQMEEDVLYVKPKSEIK